MSSLTNICFDIETIRAFEQLKDAPDQTQVAWTNFAERRFPEMEPGAAYHEKAGLYPEFGNIVCISALKKGEGVVSFALDDAIPAKDRESTLLRKFVAYVTKEGNFRFVGHNIKKFDIPYVNIRLVANKMALPNSFKMYGVKPWEMKHWDTLDIWTGGVYGSSQAKGLEVVCDVLGIESPKSEFSGAQVADMYYSSDPERMDKISKYCERDVLSTATALSLMFKYGML